MPKAEVRWNLYWVESDGLEDCFVVARNSRSACYVEINMNGFDPSQVSATRIMRIPKPLERSYGKEMRLKGRRWPGYVYGKSFFQRLGAQFRKVDEQEEMLLDEVVYSVDEYIPCGIVKQRSIGGRALSELRGVPALANYEYHRDDIWNGPERHLVTALGICLLHCQQIEHYISESFLLGVSKKQKAQYATLNDLRAGWKRKTLGNMLRCIEEAWEIEPTLKAGLDLFLAKRNRFVHGIATTERYDIRTPWGCAELIAFLSEFDVHARIVKKAFRASFYASVEFAIRNWGAPEDVSKNPLSAKEKKEMELFFVLFTPRPDSI